MEGAEGVASALVGKLGKLLGDEYRLLSGVRGEIVPLRDDVAIMNALLRMLSEADEGAVDHFVREWMKQVREFSYDAEDCIDLFVLRITPPYAGVLARARHWLVTLRARHRLANDIQDLRARALAISERRGRFGVDSQTLRPSINFALCVVPTSGHALRPANDPGQFVGIKDQVDYLTEKVGKKSDNQPDKRLKVFSIVGFGGLGKTTLAMEVCRMLEEDFDCQAIVSVSQAFDGSKDMTGLLKRILEQVKVKKDKHMPAMTEESALPNIDDTNVTTTLSNLLAGKRYLIVIDDVWTVSTWDVIRSKLQDNDCRSRIILTTRIETVAKACSPSNAGEDYMYKIKPLELTYSEQLFVSRAFGPNNTCPKELETIMGNILRKCGGLPLAIVSIASLLSSYKSPGNIEMWKRICDSIGSQMECNPTLEAMRQLITLSFNHLPHHLKICMMYLSIFPEDYVIERTRLLRRWIAEGLVVEKRGLTLLEVAESYLDELCSRNMIDPTNLDYDGSMKECHVHDMMLEVIVSKSLEANFASLVGGQCRGASYDRIRRLSIHDDKPSLGVEGMSVQHVRSLSTFRPEGHHKLLNRLAEFTLLRVLDLEDCADVQNHHLKHVCRLFLLRFLSLKGTDITQMPGTIGDLKHLQTFNLKETCLDSFPGSMVNLKKLEYLYFSNKHWNTHWDRSWRPPRGLKGMKALIVLDKIDLSDDAEVAKEIGELTQLRELHIVLQRTNQSVFEELALALGKTCSLRSLKIVIHPDTQRRLDFLVELSSPPLLLRYIKIDGIISKLPNWVKSVEHLIQIELVATKLQSAEIVSVLCELPSLMDIILWRESYTDDKLVLHECYRFPVLKKLSVTSDLDEQRAIIFDKGSMGTLETLEYRFNNWEKRLIGIEHLRNLKEVKLMGNINTNTTLKTTVEALKAESSKRPEGKQFKVAVRN